MSSNAHPNAPNSNRKQPPRDAGDSIRTPPHSDEIERAVLGCVFLDNRIFGEIASKLHETDFYRQSHRWIWRGMEALADDDMSIDTVTLGDWLDTRGKLEKVGGANWLMRLSNEVPSVTKVHDYTETLLRKSRYRKVIQHAMTTMQTAYTAQVDPEQIVGELVANLREDTDGQDVFKDAPQIDAQLGEMMTNPEKHARTWSTGIEALDLASGQFIAMGRMIYIAALAKMGKTSLAIAVLKHLLSKHGFAVDFWSTEMPETDLEARFLSNISGVPFDHVWDVLKEQKKGQNPLAGLEKDDARAIREARAEFRSWDLRIAFQGEPKIREIEMATRARVARLPADKRNKFVLFVDYLQKCHYEDYADLARFCKRLDALSKDLGICVIAAAQFNKKAGEKYAEYGKRPNFSQIHGVSQAGKDANHQFILHRPFRKDEGGDSTYTEVVHELSRHGCMGNVAALKYIEDLCRFESWIGDRPDKDTGATSSGSSDWREQYSHSPF